jgi:Phosphotransferase enzyme family
MSTISDAELWMRVAAQIQAALGWSLRPLERLGRPRDIRRTWLAEGEHGTVIVKARAGPFSTRDEGWVARALSVLAGRGYPVPEMLWHGTLDGGWSVVVQSRMPGEPLRTIHGAQLETLLSLVDLQTNPSVGPGGWNVSWWIGVVLFEGWEHWWSTAESAAPETSRRLREFLQPAWGYCLPVGDIVHGDLNLTNVLEHDRRITGVVDWDDIGVGSRATDLTGLLFDWHRLQFTGDHEPSAPDGGARLVRRIVETAGADGLRCVITYGAIARLALSAQRGEETQLAMWRRVTNAILESVCQIR